MTLSQPNRPTSLALCHTDKHKPVRTLPFKKIAAALSLCLGLSPLAQAQLPAPVESALNRAKISTDDISLLIMPVNAATNNTAESTSKKSRLPEVIKPEETKVLGSQGSSDADALPPETQDTVEIGRAHV